MAFRDQQKFLDYLKKFESRMERKELEDYKMFVKRQKDDEDFDTISMKRLKELYDKYYTSVDKSKFDNLFKKSNESGN
ncbi:MAG TPA: hypothetical protein PK073_10750 [Ignavibacteriaceae bacterium]|jgi:isopropylmalate/homocitrate/citramalate synthase|nr:MAG: hypothetical protein BWY38_02997 [Ignavibacteria bacterium ADurb.Bin266]OQY72597.1 MAG: hypothetical protein B6D44_09745 [Ignavibacteriales bacterium UTCHB2]HQF43379.1 hypothetical protein [Ignavibacteriaceae bacterium]HQI42330.1 hypothetical protein [Ignavibacteriaceae bacterium]HQJ45276.1 hypothetical protein [Ignavibacteriaceae bacterium]